MNLQKAIETRPDLIRATFTDQAAETLLAGLTPENWSDADQELLDRVVQEAERDAAELGWDWIDAAELVAAIEGQAIGRLSACWLCIAHSRANGNWSETRRIAAELSIPLAALTAVERHVAALPANQRGYVR